MNIVAMNWICGGARILAGQLLCGTLVVMALADTANADCSQAAGYRTNTCGSIWFHSKVRVTGNHGSTFDFFTTSLLPPGTNAAFGTLVCENAGVYRTLFSGPLTAGQTFTCGTGPAAGYPILSYSKCGTDSSCQ